MNKRFINYSLFVGIVALFSYTLVVQPFSLDELFKDLEQMLGDEQVQPTTPVPAQPTSTTPQPVKPRKVVATGKKDYQTLFLESLDAVPEKKGQEKQEQLELTSDHKKAYAHYMNDFVDTLKEIEKNIDTSQKFSPEFKTVFHNFKTSIDDIVIADEQIKGKKLYMNLFFKKPFEELRQKIVDTLPTIKSLHQRVVSFVSQQEETITDSSELEQLATDKPQVSFDEPTAIPTPGKRGGE